MFGTNQRNMRGWSSHPSLSYPRKRILQRPAPLRPHPPDEARRWTTARDTWPKDGTRAKEHSSSAVPPNDLGKPSYAVPRQSRLQGRGAADARAKDMFYLHAGRRRFSTARPDCGATTPAITGPIVEAIRSSCELDFAPTSTSAIARPFESPQPIRGRWRRLTATRLFVANYGSEAADTAMKIELA